MKEEEVAGLRVADLRDELKSRGLAVTGLKAALAERLLGAIRQEVSLRWLFLCTTIIFDQWSDHFK